MEAIMSVANEILIQMKYTRVVLTLAKRLKISNNRALKLFYESDTYKLLRCKAGDLHCMSDLYLVDELMLEYMRKQG